MRLYLAFIAAMSVSCVFLGVIALRGKSRKFTRKLFLLMSLSMAAFLFCVGFSVSGSSKETVVFWYRLSSIGFAPFYAFNIHFYISLAYGNRFGKKLSILYFPVPFIIASTFFSASLFRDFVFLNGFWRYSPAYSSPWFWVYVLYYFPCTASSVFLIRKWAFISGRRKQKRQANLISLFTLMTLIIGSFLDFILPYFFEFQLPPLGPVTIAFYVYGLWFVLLRYNFMEITPDLVANEIIDNINEMVFILDPSLKISMANTFAVSSLSLISDFEKYPLYFPDIIQSPENFLSLFDELKTGNGWKIKRRIVFKNDFHPVYADSYIAQFNDSFNEVSGYLVLSGINHGINDFIQIYKISKREMEIIELCIEGKSSRQIADLLFISERTVETHLTNIFQKTKTSNRIELFSLSSRYKMISYT